LTEIFDAEFTYDVCKCAKRFADEIDRFSARNDAVPLTFTKDVVKDFLRKKGN